MDLIDILMSQKAVARQIGDSTSPISTALNSAYAPKATPAPTIASLPRLVKAVRANDDTAPTTVRVIGLGSSVGLGPNGTFDDTNSVSRKVYDAITARFNRLGNATFAHTNASVGGSTITSGDQTDYATAKTNAGGAPTLAILTYGMNDGTASQYHANQTLPLVYSSGKRLIDRIQGDGGDAIILTTPHTHTGRTPWAMSPGMNVIYAGSGNTSGTYSTTPPDTAAGSVVTVTSPSGARVPAAYRFLRVNETLRQLAADTGSILIDVEPYWFDAVAKYGEDALFNTGQYNHPNLFAFQETYHKAIADFGGALAVGPAFANPLPAAPRAMAVKPNNTARASTTATTDDPDLKFNVGPGETWLAKWIVHYTTPTAADIRFNVSGTGVGSTLLGRFTVTAPGPGTTAVDSETVMSRSGNIANGQYMSAGGNAADAVAIIEATIRTTTAGATVALQWAQDVANAGNTVVYADSSLSATRVK